ncbi:hypothetical protein OSTOST_15657 [Ostertagia ostertagi]
MTEKVQHYGYSVMQVSWQYPAAATLLTHPAIKQRAYCAQKHGSLQKKDSAAIALAWTQTSRRLPLFVANQVDRIKKLHHSIQELGISLQLSYIESENNPADIATRPVAKGQFKASEWLSGPQWFKLQPSDWPIDSSWEPNSSDQISAATTCAPTVKAPPHRTHAIIPSRFELSRLVHMARAIRLVCEIANQRPKHRTTRRSAVQRSSRQ